MHAKSNAVAATAILNSVCNGIGANASVESSSKKPRIQNLDALRVEGPLAHAAGRPNHYEKPETCWNAEGRTGKQQSSRLLPPKERRTMWWPRCSGNCWQESSARDPIVPLEVRAPKHGPARHPCQEAGIVRPHRVKPGELQLVPSQPGTQPCRTKPIFAGVRDRVSV